MVQLYLNGWGVFIGSPSNFLSSEKITMIKLEIVTPEKKVIDAEVESVSVPTLTGEIGILESHAPLVSALLPGIVTTTVKGSVEKLAVSTGFVEVSNNQVSVLTDSAEKPEEIDATSAKAAKDAAEKELSANTSADVEENNLIQEKIDLAEARIQVARFGEY